MAHKAQDWRGRLQAAGRILERFLQSQPGMCFQGLLGPVTVVVEELLTGVDGVFGHEDEPGDVVHHHDLRHTVGGDAAVVHQSAIAPGFTGGVDTEISK